MNKSGAALIITLWIAAILSIVAFSVAYFARIDLKIANYQARNLQAYALARGGVELATAKLLTDTDESSGYDFYNENWFITDEGLEELDISSGKLEVQFIDEAGKINLNMENLSGLINLLQFLPGWEDYENINTLLDSFKDWRDEDSVEELNGAEDSYYLDLSNPYHCKNGKLDTPEEILLVREMNPALFQQNYFTVFGDGKININTVSEEILCTLLESQNVSGAENLARDIIAYRQGEDGIEGTDDDQPFTSTTSSLIPAEIRDFLGVKSSHFNIISTVSFKNNPITKRIEVILDRSSRPAKILYWREN